MSLHWIILIRYGVISTEKNNRVKALDVLAVATPAGPRPWTSIMSTISSDGWIRIFDIGHLADQAAKTEGRKTLTLQAIAGYDTKGTRLTCCALADGEAVAPKVVGKRKGGLADDDVSLDGTNEEVDGEEGGDAQESDSSDEEDGNEDDE